MGWEQKEPTWVVAQVGWGAAEVVVRVDVKVDGFAETALEVEEAEVEEAEVALEVVRVDGVVVVEDVEDAEEEEDEIIDERVVEELPTLTSAFLYQFA